jgi:hypothetical protein
MLLLTALLLATPSAPATTAEKTTILVMDLSTQGVAVETARIAGGIISTAVARDGRFAPASMQDLRTMVELESNRAALDCSQQSCLADLAAAMGSRYVLYGELGQLGSTLIVNLNLYDATRASSIARHTARAATVEALPDVLPPAVEVLLAALEEKPPAPDPLVIGGGIVLGAGALVAVGSGIGAGVASSIVATADQAPQAKVDALGAGRWLLGGFFVGALVAAGGGVLVGLGLAGGGA